MSVSRAQGRAGPWKSRDHAATSLSGTPRSWPAPLPAARSRCSAVGHAGDRTVAHLVAHESHPTPSAAAAALVAWAERFQRDAEAVAAAGRHRQELAQAPAAPALPWWARSSPYSSPSWS